MSRVINVIMRVRAWHVVLDAAVLYLAALWLLDGNAFAGIVFGVIFLGSVLLGIAARLMAGMNNVPVLAGAALVYWLAVRLALVVLLAHGDQVLMALVCAVSVVVMVVSLQETLLPLQRRTRESAKER